MTKSAATKPQALSTTKLPLSRLLIASAVTASTMIGISTFNAFPHISGSVIFRYFSEPSGQSFPFSLNLASAFFICFALGSFPSPKSTMHITTNIEKKLNGIDLQNSSNTFPLTEGFKDAITNIPQREIGINEQSTVGSMLKNSPVFSLITLFFFAAAYVAVDAHIMFNPSSIEVAAMIPKEVKNTFLVVLQCLSENFLNAVTAPDAVIKCTSPPIMAITKTVKALSHNDMVFIIASA